MESKALFGYSNSKNWCAFEVREPSHVFLYGRNLQALGLQQIDPIECETSGLERVDHRDWLPQIHVQALDMNNLTSDKTGTKGSLVHFYTAPGRQLEIVNNDIELDMFPMHYIRSVEVR